MAGAKQVAHFMGEYHYIPAVGWDGRIGWYLQAADALVKIAVGIAKPCKACSNAAEIVETNQVAEVSVKSIS